MTILCTFNYLLTSQRHIEGDFHLLCFSQQLWGIWLTLRNSGWITMELENFHRYVKVTAETFFNFKICENEFVCNSLLRA